MKLNGPGRPLWSEITWGPSKKWLELNDIPKLSALAEAIKADVGCAKISLEINSFPLVKNISVL
jgi:hypothetical protein